jgi:hypothetical protein
LRFSRDKRGYENTFVVHSERRRGKSRSRILYWFRTPPGVKVGRSALDEDAIRQIEELNPFVEFDWTRILKGQGAPPSESRPPAEGKRQRQPPQGRAAAPPQLESSRAVVEPPAVETEPVVDDLDVVEQDVVEQDVVEPIGAVPDIDAAPDIEEIAPSGNEAPGIDEDIPDAAEIEAAPEIDASDQDRAIVADFEAALRENSPDITAVAPPPPDPPTVAHARLGSEGVLRLRARHAEILARISERISDPARRDELRAQADRLNPDMWVTDEEVTQGLETYESVFASLREVVGRKRRRRRRAHRRARPSAPIAATEADAPFDAIAAGDERGAPAGDETRDGDEASAAPAKSGNKEEWLEAEPAGAEEADEDDWGSGGR